jgi:hypothetical protein
MIASTATSDTSKGRPLQIEGKVSPSRPLTAFTVLLPDMFMLPHSFFLGAALRSDSMDEFDLHEQVVSPLEAYHTASC